MLTARAARGSGLVPWAAGAVIVVSTLLAAAAPYEAEYEVTLLPWLLSKGWVMYRDIADQHPPLLPVALAFLGGGDPGPLLHALIALLHAAVLALTYLLASRLISPAGGLVALLLTEAWSVAFDSQRLWYDSAIGPLYLLLLLLLLRLAERRRNTSMYAVFGAGVLMALALLTKQHAVIAVPFVLLAVAWCSRPAWRLPVALCLAGLALPLVVAGALLLWTGALGDAWYWVVLYSLTSNYASAAALAPMAQDWWRLAAFYAPLLALPVVLRWRTTMFPPAVLPAMLGFVLAGTLPAWPRYGDFHLQAAVPIVCVLTAFVLTTSVKALWSKPASGRLLRHASVVAAVLAAVSAVVGVGGWVGGVRLYESLGPAEAPFEATLPPLRRWAAAHGRVAFIYGLDPVLYRVLELEPPRPWAPQLPWILAARDTEAGLWAGVERARPAVVLAPASAWDTSTQPGSAYGVPRLRLDYHEAARFDLAVSRNSPVVHVVGLLRNGGSR